MKIMMKNLLIERSGSQQHKPSHTDSVPSRITYGRSICDLNAARDFGPGYLEQDRAALSVQATHHFRTITLGCRDGDNMC